MEWRLTAALAPSRNADEDVPSYGEALLKSQAGLAQNEQGWSPGCSAAAAMLMQHPYDLSVLNIKDIYDHSPAHAAATNGHTAFAGNLFEADLASARSTNPQKILGCAAPLLAVRQGQVAAVSTVLASSACLHGMTPSGGWHALGLAVEQGQAEVVQQTLQALSSDSVRLQSVLCGQDSSGSTALDHAVSCCDGKMVRQLLSVPYGSKAIGISDKTGWTPLHRAAFLGEAEIIAQLIEASAAAETIINLQSNDGHTALMLAAREGHHEAVHQILAVSDADPNVQNSEGATALSLAMESGHAFVIQELLEALPPSRLQSVLLQKDAEGRTLLHRAVHRGKAEVVKELAQHESAALKIADADGATPMHTAAVQGHDAVVLQLLQSSFESAHSINVQDLQGFTPLMHAAQQGHAATASVLLAHPACRRDITLGDGRNALSLAVQKSHHQMVQRLIEALRQDEIEPVVCNQDQGGCTPLHHAAQHGIIELVWLLLSRPEGHAAIKMSDAAGSTPLHRAACNGHAMLVACLLQASPAAMVECAVNMQDKNGCTPLMSAAEQGHVGVVDELIMFPACQANICDSAGCTALSLASEQGCTGVVQKLLEALPPHTVQAALRHQDAMGWTPLHTAAQNGRTDMVRLLLSACGDAASAAPIADKAGWTPLHQAAFNGHASTVSQLLQGTRLAPSVVNIRKANGFTALMDAAQEGHSSVVAVLCRIPECSLDARSNKGSTALSLAAEKGHPAVVQQLLSALPSDKLQPALCNQDAWGCTPLHRAAQHGKVDSIELLLATQQGDSAAIVSTDKSGWTPLHAAAHDGHAAAVACLLQDCPSAPGLSKYINHKDKNGFTALMVAANEGRIAVLRELLKEPLCRGDAKSHLSHRRATAMTLARQNQHEEAAQLLAQEGQLRKSKGPLSRMFKK